MQTAVVECIGLGNPDMVTTVVDLFAWNHPQAYQVRPLAKDIRYFAQNISGILCSVRSQFE